MLVYTRTKIILSTLLVLSVVANAWFVWTYWIHLPPAERARFAYLFPGIETDSAGTPDTAQVLRNSFVFVHQTQISGQYELVTADRKSCSAVYHFSLAKNQVVDPALYELKPILVDEFAMDSGQVTLLKVREDAFASSHLEDLEKACPDLHLQP